MTVAVSIAMALIGILVLGMVSGDSANRNSGLSLPHLFVIPVSVLMWSYVGYKIRNYYFGLTYAVTWGIFSPFIGGLLVGLPMFIIGALVGVLTAAIYYYVTVPIGVATGLLIWLINKNTESI